MKRTPLLPLACLALLLFLGACGSDSSSNPTDQPGSFTATVTGDFTADLSGLATSTGGSGTGGWGIVLGPGSQQSITILTPGNDRPAAGTYPIMRGVQAITAPGTPFAASLTVAAGTGSFSSSEGSLTITSSSSTRVVGTFYFEADRGTVGNPEIVNVEGSFSTQNFAVGGM